MAGPQINKPGAKTPTANPSALLPTSQNDETFNEDFTGVTAGDAFQVLPEAYYLVKVMEFTKETSKSGNPQFVWKLKVVTGQYRGVTVTMWTSLLPSARWKVVQSLKAIGIECGDSIAQFKRSDVIGKVCVAKIVADEYNGRESHKVDALLVADAEQLAEAANATADKL